ncbi:hypothetical protein OQA88_2197 [Cercophora sp. LCS_1]
MAELSSNWKKLQAKIKSEPSKPAKRKADEAPQDSQAPGKKQHKAQQPPGLKKTPRPSTKLTKPTPPSNPSSSTKAKPMGSASSLPARTTPNAISPSLHLWAAENSITSESLAEAYSLGARNVSTTDLTDPPAVPNAGLCANGPPPGKYLALDCEMVGVGPDGRRSVLARVSIVDFHGRQVYDSYVKPTERVTDWRTHVSGISPKHMHEARNFDEVQETVRELVRGKVLVGHDLRHDLEVLEMEHPIKNVRDTARFGGFKKYGHGPVPSLKVLCKEVLGVEIQNGSHCSVVDARAAVLLFRRCKSGFDMEHASRFPEDKEKSGGKGGGQHRKQTKGKRRN